MALQTLLCFLLVGGALVIIFRSAESKMAQYLAIGIAVIGALEFLHRTERIRLRFGGSNTLLILSGAAAVLSLICYVRLKEKSFAMLLITAAVLQILIELRFVRYLQ